MSSGSYNNGLRDGIWEKYLSNGQLIYKGSYKNGDRDGIWEEYYSNGQLYSKLSFKNGVADGIWEKYRSNGQLIYKGSYKNGERDGYWEWYHDNGQLMSKGSYKNDKRDGYWEDYWWNGQLNSSGLYKNGELIENINEAETPKKKLFTPKRIDERKKEWNEMQPTIDGKKINQYDLTTGDMTGRWGEGDMDGGDTTNLLNVYWDVFSDDYYLEDGKLSEKENVFNDLKDRILSNLSWDMGEDAPLGHMHFDLTIPLRSKKVRDKFEELYGESEYTGLWKSNYINEGKISDNIDDILKKFKKNIGLDVGFLTSFGSGINALIRNISSLIKEYSAQPLNAFEITNLAIAMIVVYLRQNKSLKGFKDEMLSIVAFTSLMPAYSDIVNSLLGNVDFMDAFMTLIKSAGVYAMLTHFKSK
jgi:antitoxin component YwqK of YwqJK toxin-antitoxin module